jgi:hypothetical protein
MARKGRACRCHGRCQVEQLNAVLGRGDGAAVADCAANRRAADDDAATRGVDRSAVDHVALDDGESGRSGIVGGEDLDAESGIDRTGIEDVAGDGLAAGNIPGGSVGKYINSGGDVGSAAGILALVSTALMTPKFWIEPLITPPLMIWMAPVASPLIVPFFPLMTLPLTVASFTSIGVRG